MPYFHSFLRSDIITPSKIEKCSLLATALSLDHGLNIINKPVPFFTVLFDSYFCRVKGCSNPHHHDQEQFWEQK